MNFRKVLRNLCDSERPLIAFCTPEYLFGTQQMDATMQPSVSLVH